MKVTGHCGVDRLDVHPPLAITETAATVTGSRRRPTITAPTNITDADENTTDADHGPGPAPAPAPAPSRRAVSPPGGRRTERRNSARQDDQHPFSPGGGTDVDTQATQADAVSVAVATRYKRARPDMSQPRLQQRHERLVPLGDGEARSMRRPVTEVPGCGNCPSRREPRMRARQVARMIVVLSALSVLVACAGTPPATTASSAPPSSAPPPSASTESRHGRPTIASAVGCHHPIGVCDAGVVQPRGRT